jgi:hypothetical protein
VLGIGWWAACGKERREGEREVVGQAAKEKRKRKKRGKINAIQMHLNLNLKFKIQIKTINKKCNEA